MHSFTVHLEGDDDAVVEAQVVQAHVGMSLRAVFDEIYNLNLDGRLRAEMLIVRLPVEEAWSLEEIQDQTSGRTRQLFDFSSGDGPDAFERAKDRSVHILSSFQGQHVLTSNLSPHWHDDPLKTYGIAAARAIEAIQKAELNHILDRSRAVLTCPAGSRYRAPSGREVRSFVRVGNIQYSRDAIDAIFFWLLPFLSGVGAILTDTWSISSIALNIAKLSAVYFGGEPRRIEMLPSYHDGSEDAHRRTRKVVERLDADCGANATELNGMLCLISATQTGSLVARLKEIFESSPIALSPRFVAIFALAEADIATLYNLSEDHRFDLLEHRAVDTSKPVIIDAQVYFPLQFTDSIIELDKALADKSRAFFDRYVGSGLVEVHRTHQEEAGRPRHHAIHLATERLIDVPDFRRAFVSKLEELPSAPLLIVSPPHLAGRQLAAFAAQYFEAKGSMCVVHSHPNLYFSDPMSDEERDLQRMIRGATEGESLLILDDVCITGTRLSQYQRYIRSEGFKGRIDYLVGIARPRSPETWTRLRRYLSYRRLGPPRHTVKEVEYVLFPDWGEVDCPWCQETRVYERWAAARRLPGQLVERLQFLSGSMASGLTRALST